MTCDQLADRASDVIDGSLAPAWQAEVDAHLTGCARCRALVADLRLVRQTAATLGRSVPPPGAWSRVAARLEADPEFQRAGAARRQASGTATAPGWAWLAAAAVLVAVVGGGLWFMTRSLQPPVRSAEGEASPAALVESIESELQLAADHYEKAITALEQVARQSESPFDPELTATLRANLDLIDRAIDESRRALGSQPDNRVAQESLFEAFRRKIGLLQDTIALMNEMRKGNQAGAARIVEGLNKS
jgi:anti-sigma factor RsiW